MAMVIGTILPECLHSLASALKFGRVNPAPDMTKRITALTLITKGSWPSVRYSIQNVLLTRSTTSLKELNLYSGLYGISGLVAMRKATFFLPFLLLTIYAHTTKTSR